MSDKRCPRCKVTKPIEDFTPRLGGGVESYCKPCKAAYSKEQREARAGVITPADIARFWGRVDKNGPPFEGKPCWVWKGAPRNHEGYGQFHIAGRNLSPHTVMFMLTLGIEGSREIFVDHQCKNRMCLNPDHLRFVTPRVNALENNNSPFAVNAAKTHCAVCNNPLSGDNLGVHKVRCKRRGKVIEYIARACLTCYPRVRNSRNRIYPENRS